MLFVIPLYRDQPGSF